MMHNYNFLKQVNTIKFFFWLMFGVVVTSLPVKALEINSMFGVENKNGE